MNDRLRPGDATYHGRFLTGLTSGLQTLFSLAERPDLDATRRLMQVFSQYRSLATTHLWQINQPNPS